MTEQNKTKVPAELIPAGNYPVVSTDAVMDKQKGKTQEEVNTEAGEKIAALEESVGSGGSVDTRIENAVNTEKARAENVEAQLSNEIDVLQKQDVVPVDSLPSVAEADPKKIYRVVGTTSYTDYMVDTMADPTAWKTLATYSFPGIDDTPIAGSENLVKSGGVYNSIHVINLNKLNNKQDAYGTRFVARQALPAAHRNRGVIFTYLLADGWITEQWVGAASYNIYTDGDFNQVVYSDDIYFVYSQEIRNNIKELYLEGVQDLSMINYLSFYQKHNNVWGIVLTDTNNTILARATIVQEAKPNDGVFKIVEQNNSGVSGYVYLHFDDVDINISSKLYNNCLVLGNCPCIIDYLSHKASLTLINELDNSVRQISDELQGISDDVDAIKEQLTEEISLTPINHINGFILYGGDKLNVNDSSTQNYVRCAVYDITGISGTYSVAFPSINNSYIAVWGIVDSLVQNAIVVAKGPAYNASLGNKSTVALDGQHKYLIVACLKDNETTSAESVITLNDRVEILEDSVNDINNSIEEINDKIATVPEVEVILPSNIIAVVGDTLQLFYRGIVLAVNPNDYDIVVRCLKGAQYNRYFEYTPTIEDIGNVDFSIDVLNNQGDIIATNTCTLTTVAEPVGPQTNKNILCFGDSLTSNGEWPAEAARRLLGNGGSPAGKSLNHISFCGSLTKDLANYFGAGGWTWGSYIYKGRDAYRFTVSGVTSVGFRNTYSNNGTIFTVQEVNITNGSGTILCSVQSGSPQSSGVLTKVSGGGDATIQFSSVVYDIQNPLWDEDNNKFSFIPYAQQYCNSQIDAVYILLTWNGMSAFKKDFTDIINQVKIFADTLHAEYPMAKLKILGIQAPNQKDTHGYGANGGYADKYGMTYTALKLKQAYNSFADSSEISGTSGDAYSSFVEFIDIASQFDSDNNMQVSLKDVNIRNSEKEYIGSNGVHPANSGYMQIADAVYRNIVANFCQS